MERRDFLSLVPAVGFVLLAPKLAFANAIPLHGGLYKEVLLQRILHSEALAERNFNLRQETADSKIWPVILQHSETFDGRQKVHIAHENVSHQRLGLLEYNPPNPTDAWLMEGRNNAMRFSIKDLGVYYEWRRALSFLKFGLPNLRQSKSFALTCYLYTQMGWEPLQKALHI